MLVQALQSSLQQATEECVAGRLQQEEQERTHQVHVAQLEQVSIAAIHLLAIWMLSPIQWVTTSMKEWGNNMADRCQAGDFTKCARRAQEKHSVGRTHQAAIDGFRAEISRLQQSLEEERRKAAEEMQSEAQQHATVVSKLQRDLESKSGTSHVHHSCACKRISVSSDLKSQST